MNELEQDWKLAMAHGLYVKPYCSESGNPEELIEFRRNDLAAFVEDIRSEQANEVERLRNAIERALADEESGKGWGPDVTVCAYLREALSPNAN